MNFVKKLFWGIDFSVEFEFCVELYLETEFWVDLKFCVEPSEFWVEFVFCVQVSSFVWKLSFCVYAAISRMTFVRKITLLRFLFYVETFWLPFWFHLIQFNT